MMEKFREMAILFDKWMTIKEKKINLIDEYFGNEAYRIGIYGYGKIGRHIVHEIELSKSSVLWIADQRANDIKGIEYTVVLPDRIKVEPDYTLVTAIEDQEKIEKNIMDCINTRIIFIGDMIEAVFNESTHNMQ